MSPRLPQARMRRVASRLRTHVLYPLIISSEALSKGLPGSESTPDDPSQQSKMFLPPRCSVVTTNLKDLSYVHNVLTVFDQASPAMQVASHDKTTAVYSHQRCLSYDTQHTKQAAKALRS